MAGERYWVPKSFREFTYNELAKQDGLTPYYFVRLPAVVTDNSDALPKYQSQNIPFFHWFLRNADGYEMWVGSADCKTIAFRDLEIAKKFKFWLETEWINRYNVSQYLYSQRHIFLTQETFLRELDKQGSLKIEAKVDHKLDYYDYRTSEITEETFLIWCWFEENLKHSVYRWSGTFYFEDADDATMFKLTWSGNAEAAP